MKSEKIFLLGTALFCSIFSMNAEELVWNKENKFDKWTEATFCKAEAGDDGLVLSAIRFDSRITNSKLNIDPSKYNSFTYTYKSSDAGVSRGGQLYFARKGENCSDSRMIPLPALKTDGKWHTVTVDMSKNKHWLGTEPIALLRLDLTDAAGGSIIIREIAVRNSETPVVWNGKNQFSGWNHVANAAKKLENGNIVLTNVLRDCQLYNKDVRFDPEKYNVFVMRYRAKAVGKASGQLYYSSTRRQGYSDRHRWVIPQLNADGQWHEIKLTLKDLVSADSWTQSGMITSLRLDPTDSAAEMIEISEIRFEQDPAAPKDGK